jgi:hypothetical protein
MFLLLDLGMPQWAHEPALLTGLAGCVIHRGVLLQGCLDVFSMADHRRCLI